MLWKTNKQTNTNVQSGFNWFKNKITNKLFLTYIMYIYLYVCKKWLLLNFDFYRAIIEI